MWNNFFIQATDEYQDLEDGENLIHFADYPMKYHKHDKSYTWTPRLEDM
jgi:hypothetical protein